MAAASASSAKSGVQVVSGGNPKAVIEEKFRKCVMCLVCFSI